LIWGSIIESISFGTLVERWKYLGPVKKQASFRGDR